MAGVAEDLVPGVGPREARAVRRRLRRRPRLHASTRPGWSATPRAPHGLGVRLHAGQFADVGGAHLAASLGAASVDHLEHVSAGGIQALAVAGVIVVLLPIAGFSLDQQPPPVAFLREAGVPLAIASDANPGTAPTESLPLAMALAVQTYRVSPDEAILGVTRIAAASLELIDRGMLRRGSAGRHGRVGFAARARHRPTLGRRQDVRRSHRRSDTVTRRPPAASRRWPRPSAP